MVDEVTFDFIWNCWKEKNYPDDFDNLLEKYLEIKAEIFSNTSPPEQITSWLSKVIISIEIGLLRDEKRFGYYKKYWESLLGRKWVASIEDRWVEWKIE